MGLLKVCEIFRSCIVTLRLDVFPLDDQKPRHVCHVVGKERWCALDYRNHHRQNSQADQKSKVIFADVIDVFVFAGCPAGHNKNRRVLHGSKFWSASTNFESFSRPCEATRMWKLSMPVLFEQSLTYMSYSFNRSPCSSAAVIPPLILNRTKVAPVGYTSIPAIAGRA